MADSGWRIADGRDARSVIDWRALACVLAVIALLPSGAVHAQGDGPRSQLMLPTGVNFLLPTYINLEGNFNFAESILIPGADVKSDVYVLTYMRAFDLGGRYAHLWVNTIWGHVDGGGTITNPGAGQVIPIDVQESGWADAIVSFKLGLIGTEPLPPAELVKFAQPFQLSAFASVSIPVGEYDSDRPLNLGTNVWALRLGAPMVFPVGDPHGSYFLEVLPSVTFFEDNDDPTGGASKREQDPLFVIESHLSHNFMPKFWASLDLRYRYGGETTTDGVDDDNTANVLGGGFSFGYSFTPKVGMQASWGNVLLESDGSDQEMLRVKFIFSF
jgi:Putative MetA-pathway of phenol degradation